MTSQYCILCYKDVNHVRKMTISNGDSYFEVEVKLNENQRTRSGDEKHRIYESFFKSMISLVPSSRLAKYDFQQEQLPFCKYCFPKVEAIHRAYCSSKNKILSLQESKLVSLTKDLKLEFKNSFRVTKSSDERNIDRRVDILRQLIKDTAIEIEDRTGRKQPTVSSLELDDNGKPHGGSVVISQVVNKTRSIEVPKNIFFNKSKENNSEKLKHNFLDHRNKSPAVRTSLLADTVLLPQQRRKSKQIRSKETGNFTQEEFGDVAQLEENKDLKLKIKIQKVATTQDHLEGVKATEEKWAQGIEDKLLPDKNLGYFQGTPYTQFWVQKRRFRCSSCQVVFKSRRSIREHIGREHLSPTSGDPSSRVDADAPKVVNSDATVTSTSSQHSAFPGVSDSGATFSSSLTEYQNLIEDLRRSEK